MEALKLSRELYQYLVHHARGVLPREAVGLLGGHPDGTVTVAIPLPNLAGARAFWADPFAQFQAQRRLEQAALQLVGIYHSHPSGGSDLSPLDLTFAQSWPCAHLVIVPEKPNGGGDVIRAFRIDERLVIPVEIRIEGGVNSAPESGRASR